jgi:hypoxanthine phosphoribosyltransferase
MTALFTWSTVVDDSEALARIITASGFSPDLIVAVARGGFVPARLLANHFRDASLASIAVAYVDAARTELVVSAAPGPLVRWSSVVVVEDCLESGRSLQRAVTHFRDAGLDVHGASLYTTPATVVEPDSSVRELTDPPRLPWEGA